MPEPLFRIQELFFDRPAVVAATDPAERRALSKAGAFVMRDAKSNTRKAKKTSRAGESPRGKLGLLRDNIFFSYEPNSRSVLIGPAKLNGTDGTVPRLLEEGGDVTLQVFVVADVDGEEIVRGHPTSRTRRAKKPRFRTSRKAPRRRVRYEPRPYMHPAFAKTLPKVPSFFRDSIRRR